MNLYFEDFAVGQRFETGSVTVTEDDIVAFGMKFDPQYYHVDPVDAKRSPFGGLIASGFHTLSLSMSLFFRLDIWPESMIASPGLEDVKFIKPLRPGDTIRCAAEVVDIRPSASKPDRGIIVMQHPCWNQKDEMILTLRVLHLVRRR